MKHFSSYIGEKTACFCGCVKCKVPLQNHSQPQPTFVIYRYGAAQSVNLISLACVLPFAKDNWEIMVSSPQKASYAAEPKGLVTFLVRLASFIANKSPGCQSP